MPKVSVVVPCYNHAGYVEARIRSILNQTFQDFELIIMDDNSPDNSQSVLRQFEHHPKVSHFIMNEQNTGNTFKQWNKGVKLAKGEYVWIAESDDLARPEFLETLVPILQKQSGICMAYTQSTRLDEKDNDHGKWKFYTESLDAEFFNSSFTMKGQDFIKRFLVFENVVPNVSALLFRKAAFEETGGASETIKYCSDWLQWLKMLINYDVSFVSEPLNYFRFHSDSVIATTKKNNRHLYLFDAAMRKEYRNFLLSISNNVLLAANDHMIRENYMSYGIVMFNEGNKKEGARHFLKAGMEPNLNLEMLISNFKYIVSRLIK